MYLGFRVGNTPIQYHLRCDTDPMQVMPPPTLIMWFHISLNLQKGQPSPVLGSRWALYLFVAIAPCTILHWRSIIPFSTGGLYRSYQQPLEEQSASNTSVHFDSLSPVRELRFRTFTQLKYSCFFPTGDHFAQRWSLQGERQAILLSPLPTTGLMREGNTYSWPSLHCSASAQSRNKVLSGTDRDR